MRKKVVILAAIVVIIVSVAVTVANMSDGQVDVLLHGGNGITDDIIAQSTISTLETEELSYDDDVIDLGMSIALLDVGHAVLFSPPTERWTLDKIRVVGNLTGFYYSGIFALEIWDSDYNLLYKLTDSNFAYFEDTYKLTVIDIPDQDITGNFYVCIFERSGINVGCDVDNPAMRSYVVVRDPKIMYNATYPDETDTEKPFNWMVRAVGRKTS